VSTRVGLDAVARYTLVLHVTVTAHVPDLEHAARVHELAVFVPVDSGRRVALRLAQQRHILLLCCVDYNRVRGVVADEGRWCLNFQKSIFNFKILYMT
jgi:hypothetical protein